MMGMKITLEATASLCRCTPRCMLSSTSLACLHRSESRFKARVGENCCMKHEGQIQTNQNSTFHGSERATRRITGVPQSRTGKHGPRTPYKTANSNIRVEENSRSSEETSCGPFDSSKSRDSRRRDSRLNGADIYVARVTKNGMGSAKPCWRCLHWCHWAGIKRIFHWNNTASRWEVVKVNSPGTDQYETTTDTRLYARKVSGF